MKVLLVYVTGVPGISGYIFSGTKNFQLDLISAFGVGIFALFAIYIFTLLISLIAPERILQKGSEPKVTFQREIFLANDSQIAFKNLLFNEIDRIQDKIERIQTNNKKRVSRYKSVLRASLILVAVLVFALVKKLFTGS
jgi:hypothetical protein